MTEMVRQPIKTMQASKLATKPSKLARCVNVLGLIFSLFFIVNLTACGDDSSTSTPESKTTPTVEATTELPAQAAAGTTNLPVWKISDADSHIYLVGSIHVLSEADTPINARFFELVKKSDEVIFESDIAKSSSIEFAQQMMAISQYPAGDELANHLNQTTYSQLVELNESLGIPTMMTKQMPGWYWYLTLPFILGAEEGYGPDLGVDMTLYNEAKAQNKSIGFLEDSLAVFESLKGISDEDSEKLLADLLSQLDDIGAMYAEMVTLWQTGDLVKLDEWWKMHAVDVKSFEKLVIDDRNVAWFPQIVQRLEQNSTAMIVVGFGHMLGEKSLLKLLQEKDYSIEQMQSL